MPEFSCKQCSWRMYLRSRDDGVRALISHTQREHTLIPTGIELDEGKLLYDVMRRYQGKDAFGKKGHPVDPKTLD